MVQLFTTDRSFVLENIVKFILYKIGASAVNIEMYVRVQVIRPN